MSYTVLIAKDSTAGADISSLVEKITWKGRKGSSSRSVTIKLLDDDGYHHDRSGIDVEEGYRCLIMANGKEIFQGIAMSSNQQDTKIMSFKAYDNGIYLANNRDTFCYTNMTASEIFVDVCTRFGLEIGEVTATNYVIPELIKKRSTGWDVICDAMSQDFKATGVRHYVSSFRGKINMTTRRENIMKWVLEVGTNITSYNYTKSIEDVRTRIRLLSDEGTVLAENHCPDLEAKIGIMQDVQVLDETLNTPQLEELCMTILGQISTPARSLSLDALGLTDVYSGIGVVIVIPHLGISQLFYVDEDTHTFEGNKHTMHLSLTLATDTTVGAAGDAAVGTAGGGGTQQTQTSIKSIFQSTMTVDSEMIQGTVISTSPLRIQMVNDAKLVITETSAILPQHLTDYTVACVIDGASSSVKICNALKAGDTVHLLSLQGGKKYYVLDRV